MDFMTFFRYFFAIATGITALGIAFQIYQKYKLKYLYFYTTYLVIHYLLGYFVLEGLGLIENLPVFSLESRTHLAYLFGILRIPVIPLMIYMFIKTEKGLLKQSISRGSKKIFFLFWAILFILYLGGLGHYFNTANYDYLTMILRIVFLATGICFYLAAVELFVKSKLLSETAERAAAKTVGAIYLAIFTVYAATFMLTALRLIEDSSSIFPTFLFIMHFSFNLPPLLYIRHALKRSYPETLLHPFNAIKMDAIYEKFNLSKREAEILNLMLTGKKAKEIEKELYISYHTVRNHIYHIYRKTGARNRIQVFRLIQDHLLAQDE
jgi:DNA-binding CsgD family transcriptional regulator